MHILCNNAFVRRAPSLWSARRSGQGGSMKEDGETAFPHALVDSIDDPYEPLPPLPVFPAASLATLAPPDPPLLGPIAPGTITVIRGPRGVGKSWLALAMARAIAAGDGLLGWEGRQAPVVHVDAAMA